MKQAIEKYRGELESIREAGTWREERVITTPQLSRIDTTQAKRVVNMCANNYLGLSDHPALIQAAKESYDRWGFGLSSVRFICGTQAIHKELEGKLAEFLGMDDAILYSSCFDANGGLFETLLGPEDAVISDELPLQEQRHGGPAPLPGGRPGLRLPGEAHRHRRRVLHGRLHRQPPGDLRSGR